MSHFLARIFNTAGWRRYGAAGVSCLLLAGCSASLSNQATKGREGEQLPQQQVADFLSTDCADIWSLHGEVTDKNPLYWLRGMDCADRLSPEMARAEARLHGDEIWQDALKRGILLANAKITPMERREMVNSLNALSSQIPAQVRPLYQVWRDGQVLQLQLSDSRTRYAKLQQSTDSELDSLRQQQQDLRDQIDITTQKLQNLTDIERRLSTRKPARSFSSESHSGDKASVGKSDARPGEEKP